MEIRKSTSYMLIAGAVLNWLLDYCICLYVVGIFQTTSVSFVTFMTPALMATAVNLVWVALELSRKFSIRYTTERYFLTCLHIAAGVWLYFSLPPEIQHFIVLLMCTQALFFLNGAVGFMRTFLAGCLTMFVIFGMQIAVLGSLNEVQTTIAILGFNFVILASLFNQQTRNEIRRRRKSQSVAEEAKKTVESLNQQIKEQVLVRYLPPDLINDIFDGKISMDTKPHTKQITVLFSDLSGFTRMSEKHGAEVVSDFLNDYLSIMNETIFAHQGTIDKFIGDAIMVIFGAPHTMSEEEQAQHACQCAIAMQHGMRQVNDKWQAQGIEQVLMRIGIHQGNAVVGNFGSKQRVDYTAIGPSVNLASRIESACEPGCIYLSRDVRELLHDDPPTSLAGEFELKGIQGKTSLYRLV